MKTFLKIFTCAVAMSIALMACDDFGTNPDSNSDSNSNSTVSCPQYAPKSTIYYSYDVKDWIDEQIASGSKERKLIWIGMSDLPLINNPIEEPAVTGTYNSTTGEAKYFLNGQEVTYDELKEITEAWRQERIKLLEELISSYMSSVHIPGENVEILHGGWKALMTAEEIVELAENNEGLSISFWVEAPAPYMPVMPGDVLGGNGDVLTMEGSSSNSSSRCP